MSEEKKFKTKQPLYGFTPEEMPEWALGHEGLENLLDGMRVQNSVNKQMIREGNHVMEPELDGLNMDEYKDMSPEHKTFEVLAGCLVAYFAAMSQAMPKELFARSIGPLIDVICTSFEKIGVYEPMDEERTKKVMDDVKEKYKSNKAEKEKDKQLAREIAEFDKPSALQDAIDKLKAVGKGILN